MEPEANISTLTADIVSAYAANNSIAHSDLPKLIEDVHKALVDASLGRAKEPEIEHKPVVSIKASIKPDFIVCLECGKKQKSLKRHLSNAHELTPDGYRARYKLSPDYPLVSPNYSASRSKLAKTMGLGRKAAAAKK